MDITIHAAFLPHTDAEAALAFYRDTLGFELRKDVGYEGMRWLTLGPAGQPDTSVVLHPPAVDPGITDDERRTILELLAKGSYGSALMLATDDLDAVFKRLVDGGADVADRHIADHATSGDLVVTQDVPLAALLVPKGIAVLDPRGEEHTGETVGERLSVRDFMEQARIAGLVTGGPAPYDARAKQAFAAALDRVLTRLRRPA